MVSYEGIFFDKDVVDLIHTLEEEKLPVVNDEIHCTFKYHPNENEIFDELVGKEIEVLITGYANDGNNSGFQLKLPEEVVPYYINYDEEDQRKLKVPHITASIKEGSSPSNTKNLNFKPLDNPIPIKGKFGYWIKDNDKEYVSYEPYNKSRESHNFDEIKKAQLKANQLINNAGVKLYLAGGIVPYLLTRKNSGRLHDDIDAICNYYDTDKLRQIFITEGLYKEEWDSKQYAKDGIDYGFEVKIDDVPFGIYPFIYDAENKTITQYSFDPYNHECKTKIIPIEKLSDYIMTYESLDGNTYNTMSLEYIKMTKDKAGREKDLIDSRVIQESGLIREDVLGRVQMYAVPNINAQCYDSDSNRSL